MNPMDMFPKKKRVLLRGPVLTQSGYGVHARQVARWLLGRKDLEVEVQALPWGDTPWLINPELEDGLVGSLMEKTVDPKGKKYDATVQIQLPNEWDPALGEVNIGISAVVETDKCNPEWVSACNRMTMVIVPSNHSAGALRASGEVKVPLHVVPESYSDAVTKGERTKVDDLEFSTSFNFLLFGQITGNNPENDRKNIFYTIKWLCELFKDDKDVGVVLKTNVGRNTAIDRKLVTQMMTTLLGEVRRGPYPRFHLVHGDLTDAEVASLYRHKSIKALVTATRGEGYGLPILEAAASGLPVVATRWSGHTDFLRHGKYVEIDYRLEEIHQSRIDNKIFLKGMRWANPQEEDFKKKAKKLRESHLVPRDWASSLRDVVLKKYSPIAVTESYESVVKDVL